MPTTYPYAAGKDLTYDAWKAQADYQRAIAQQDADFARTQALDSYNKALADLTDQGVRGSKSINTSMLGRGVYRSGETNRRQAELAGEVLKGKGRCRGHLPGALGKVDSDLARAHVARPRGGAAGAGGDGPCRRWWRWSFIWWWWRRWRVVRPGRCRPAVLRAVAGPVRARPERDARCRSSRHRRAAAGVGVRRCSRSRLRSRASPSSERRPDMGVAAQRPTPPVDAPEMRQQAYQQLLAAAAPRRDAGDSSQMMADILNAVDMGRAGRVTDRWRPGTPGRLPPHRRRCWTNTRRRWPQPCEGCCCSPPCPSGGGGGGGR